MKEKIKKIVRTRFGDDKGEIFSDDVLDTFFEAALLGIEGYSGKVTDICLYTNALFIVQNMIVDCLGRSSLIEKGREFTIKDSNGEFTPPPMSDTLMEQFRIETHNLMEMIRRFDS